MRLVLFFLMGLAPTASQAQTVVDACKRVAMFEFGISEVYASDVQAFPELDPPRVRMRVRGEAPSAGAVSDVLAEALGFAPSTNDNLRDFGLVRCEFESHLPPFDLALFECAGMACFINDSRLEELRVLLGREFTTQGADR